MFARRALASLVVPLLVVVGCRAEPVADGPAADAPVVRPDWAAGVVEPPGGAPGRLLVRDAVACGGRWYAVGAVAAADGGTRPAFWASDDGRSWRARAVRAESFYGARNVLYAVGCRDPRVAALGAKSGGAHGNPRVSAWRQAADGALVEVPAEFETFGGPEAVAVARVAGGPGGWLIAGGRVSGAAVWTSPDAGEFTLRSGVAQLAGDARGRTAGLDAVAASDGWVVVGWLLPPGGTAFVPVVWTSSDGRSWRRSTLPDRLSGVERDGSTSAVGDPASAGGSTRGGSASTGGSAPGGSAPGGSTPGGSAPGGSTPGGSAERVVSVAGEPVVVGAVGQGFVLWRRVAGRWRVAGGFAGAAGGAGVRSVDGLAADGAGLAVAVGVGAERSLWWSGDGGGSWGEVALPVEVPGGGDHPVTVTVGGGRLVVFVDDGRSSGVWSVRTADLVR
ncbi:hypothetical protein [Micromonospora yangpuensis]|uniref:hypothetical protein n=1 Tax=Micromonospora yangpuensis TaxID=683228 RepID=UPI000B074D5A|nr:hypothetical protein [Micromonospora yangpuensis]GGL95824.1 hypothetical protein GCM10012279_11580 [Micromonospora yangpuensis]